MYTQNPETHGDVAVLESFVGFRDLAPGELAGISGGLPVPAVIAGGLLILGAIGALAIAGIVVGVGIYVWTHGH